MTVLLSPQQGPAAPLPAWRRHGWAVVAPVVAASLVSLGLMLGWRGVDLPAQLYRVTMVRNDGFTIWDSQWYGGHWNLDYSVVFPSVAAAIGVDTVAIVSAALAALAFDRLLIGALGRQARLASLVFAAGTIVQTAIGQLPFLMGESFALCACWAAARRKWPLAVACAVVSALASPLAAGFLALAAVAWLVSSWPSQRWGIVSVTIAALAPLGITSLVFPGQGPMPYPGIDYCWEVAIAAGLWVLTPRAWRAVRVGELLVIVAATVSELVPSPVGGNIGRIEDCVALPLAVAALWPHLEPTSWLPALPWRRVLLGLVAVPLLLSQWGPAWGAMTSDASQPSTHAAFYAPLLSYLQRAGGPMGRVEVVPTEFHYEATYVAPSVELARGWERQLDEANNPIFYQQGAVTATSYRQWLLDNGVRFVALPNAPLDYAATAEAALVRRGLPGLNLVWMTGEWRVYAVAGSTGIASGPAQLTQIQGDDVTLDASGPGAVLLRVRWTPNWTVADGDACVQETPAGWTDVQVQQAGPVRLQIHLFAGDPDDCTKPTENDGD